MQNEIVEINSKEVVVKEFKGQRVVTFKDIDRVHERPDGTARTAFNRNRKHFIEGQDYFVCKTYEARELFGMSAPNGVLLMTEQGYLMLVKPFTDDLAWTVQRQLVNNYFKQEPVHSITYQYPISPAALESATNAGRLFERIMKSEGACPHEIAMVVKSIFNQAGIEVREQFVKIPAYEQLALDIITR